MESERPSSSKSAASLQSANLNIHESDTEVFRSPSVTSWHHHMYSHDVEETRQEWLHRIHSEPLLDNQPPAAKEKNQHHSQRAQSAGVRKLLPPRFGGKTNVIHPSVIAESSDDYPIDRKAWNEVFISQDFDGQDTAIIKTASSPDPYAGDEPRFKTPPPRLGSAKARVAPAPEGFLETEKALKKLNTVLKKRRSTTESIDSVDEQGPSDTRQESSPSPVSSYDSRPNSRTSLLGRRSSAAKMHHKPSIADMFTTQTVHTRADSQSAKNKKESPSSGSRHSTSSQSVVGVEEATGEKVVEAIANVTLVEHQPYIPLHTAQQALENVVNDMHRMKANHLYIVDEIETAYKDIEDESKLQYRSYIQNLRKQHGSKMSVYKQVVKLLQNEIDKMKEYWEGTTSSLASRNRELLLENKTLYDELKNGLQQMERDKETLVSKFTRRIEKERRRKEEELKKVRQSLEETSAKCSEVVKTTEANASAQLSQERDLHNQALADLQRKLVEKDTELEELAKKQRATLVHIATKEEHELLVNRSQTEAQVPLKQDEQQVAVTEEAQFVASSDESSEKMKKAIKEAKKELNSTRVKLHSMLGLFDTEPSLRDAFHQTLEEARERITVLQQEREDTEKQIGDWHTNFQENFEKEPAEDYWDEALTDAKSRLETINSEMTVLEEKITTLNSVQVSFGYEQKSMELSRSIGSTKKVVFLDEEITSTIVAEEEQSSELPESKDTDQLDIELEEQHSVIEEQAEPEIPVTQDDETGSYDATVQDTEPDILGEEHLEVGEMETESSEIQESSEAVKDERKPATAKETKKGQAKKSGSQATKQTKQAPSDSKQQEDLKKEYVKLKKQGQADQARIKALERELKEAPKGGAGGGSSVEDKRELKKKDKELKELKRLNETSAKTIEKIQAHLKSNEAELASLKKENEKLVGDVAKSGEELDKLKKAAKDGIEAAERLKALEVEVKKQAAELKTTIDNYNSERILRKKYYNLIEDMKGKIRVYCRVRPLSGSEKARNNFSVIESPDEYTLNVRTQKKLKEFQFDQVFTEEHSQEKVFEDSKNLIQSAVDGYNVCIFAYGQTGSGKTYTMIGGKDASNKITAPGIAPRAFGTIFELIEANRKKYSFSVSCYMLELYNDRLLDLFQANHQNQCYDSLTAAHPPRLDIKKDKKGMVVIHGAITHDTETAEGLMELFDNGSKNRHIASTKMNAESSRSHLIIGVVIESTNLANGTVHRGKLSLVDLAGSERASKTGATAEQLKEAQSINKSLSALGDVISALSSGQDFVPYRNNKLTMLMQDSLGGNAKTLMFVNISPADYNADETVISLTYAARVKLITNDASKNADNKEIARLKGIIARLRKGEDVGEDEV